MPSFLKDLSLRRKSKASLRRPEPSGSTDNSSSNDGDEHPPSKSSSTLNTYLDRTSPPTTLSRSSTFLAAGNSNGQDIKPPSVPGSRAASSYFPGSRYSLLAPSSQQGGSPPRHTPATSPYAPRVLSVSDNSWVHQRVLLVFGQCADPQTPIDGQLTVFHHQDSFPSTQWPVNDAYFKALVHLNPGPNRLRLEFSSSQVIGPNGSPQLHSSWININYLPLNSAPPLQLCILLAKDSPGTFDAPPERIEREGNGLETAVRKFRTAAYLWQAFTAEQMNRNGFGRRCYRYEEEWQQGTLSSRDVDNVQMRNEAKIHIIRLPQTLAEIRSLDIAQQYEPAKNKGDLFGIAMDAVRSYFQPSSEQTQYVSCMFLDTKWDREYKTIRGHAALGGGGPNVQLAIFGSHCLHAYPTHIEEVVSAFTDCTPTDTAFVANDCNESGSSWEAANIGIGAHLHETGHLLGCPHQESGVMLRDYVTLNRTFVTRESFSTRTKQQGKRLCLQTDECAWHRLDVLRFRFHPTFQLPTDPVLNSDKSVQAWTVDNGTILVTAASGIAWLEIFPEGDTECHHWIEYIDQNGLPTAAPKQVMLTEQMIRDKLPEHKRKRRFKVDIFSCGAGYTTIDDVANFANKDGKIKLPDGRPGFKGNALGHSQMQDSQPQQVIFGTCEKLSKLMRAVKVYAGASVDGIEFFYEDNSSALFGKRGGKPGGHDFALDIRRSETIIGFYVRAGAWIDAVQILTSTGRKSDIFGNAHGGQGHTLIPPRGYSIAGIYGSCGPWCDGLGLIITR